MKKYGLQLRVQPQQKKQPTKPPVAASLGFNDDDDDYNVERDIMRQAFKNKSHRDIEEQHKKALEEDPSVFDYDGVYDKMKEEQVLPKQKERQDQKPRYIQELMDKAKQREREHEIIYERKLAKERSQDEHLYADKDKFVTSAYKRKLAEQAKWMEEERLREMREEKEDSEEQHKKALEEDPSVFEYDGVYDEMKAKQVHPKEMERRDRKPRYIQALMDKAKQREREHEIIYERKLAKERSQDEHLYADKDKFVAGAYKRKLAEQAKWMEEERPREMREKEDVTEKSDLSDFYFNLAKNVAFGAGETDLQKHEQPEGVVAEVYPPAVGTCLKSSTPVERQQNKIAESLSNTSTQDQVTNESSSQPIPNHHQRTEDAVVAAKARFLARKNAKLQMM